MLAGQAGLLQAIDRFDPDKGFRFSTYATHWVRQAVGHGLREPGLWLAEFIRNSLRRIKETRTRLRRELDWEPTDVQLARALGIPLARLRALLRYEG